jgi:hypothetical protein
MLECADNALPQCTATRYCPPAHVAAGTALAGETGSVSGTATGQSGTGTESGTGEQYIGSTLWQYIGSESRLYIVAVQATSHPALPAMVNDLRIPPAALYSAMTGVRISFWWHPFLLPCQRMSSSSPNVCGRWQCVALPPERVHQHEGCTASIGLLH